MHVRAELVQNQLKSAVSERKSLTSIPLWCGGIIGIACDFFRWSALPDV